MPCERCGYITDEEAEKAIKRLAGPPELPGGLTVVVGGQANITISGLAAKTTYEFMVRSVNTGPGATITADVMFTTS